MTRTASAAWEMGSDFDWKSAQSALGPTVQAPPWVAPGKAVIYVESGRQALGLVADALGAEGYTNLLMPAHFCDSMLNPFRLRGWNISHYSVSSEWQCSAPSEPVSQPERTLILSMSFFGVPESEAWLAFLSEQISRGSKVLSDESHRALSEGLDRSHYRVGSLRKMLPVADGAFLIGLTQNNLPEGRQADARSQAMRIKSAFLGGHHRDDHRAAFLQAEIMTESDLVPARMSEASREMVHRFDYAKLRAARTRNHATLQLGLDGSEFHVTTGAADVPSHCVVSGRRAPELRSHLTKRKIYCPIHWPPPSSSTSRTRASWRSDVLSLPVDHRYGDDDMASLVDAVRAFESGGS